MLHISVKMFQEETTAESDKSIDAVTHTRNEFCINFTVLQQFVDEDC